MQVGDEEDTISFDLKPSDAINIAFRCKVCIRFLTFHSTSRVHV